MNETKIEKVDAKPIIQLCVKNIAEQNGIKGDTSDLKFGYITYNEDINTNYDYQIIRSVTCDGTMMFLYDIYFDVMQLLINQESYCKKNAPKDISLIKGCKYEIGDFKVETEYGDFGTEEKPWLSLKWTVYLPVKVKYTLNK